MKASNTSYQCTFVKYLWKDADKKRKRLYQTLEREVILPFVPELGHEVTEGDWFSGKLERIVWDNDLGVFNIKAVDVIPNKGLSAELLLEVSLKQGWKARKQD